MAITRRIGYGKKIVMGDKKLENAQEIAKVMNDAGFDVEPMENGFIFQRIHFKSDCKSERIW